LFDSLRIVLPRALFAPRVYSIDVKPYTI